MRHSSKYTWLVTATLLLALCVIVLGAYTRLADAGLGCPDWPTCYGKLVLPHAKQALTSAQKTFPQQPIVATKAWTEMTHRYFAGILGGFILALAIWASLRKNKHREQALFVPWLLVATVIFQAVLGMWTVTLKLLPAIVTLHLLGGMTTAALLCWLMLHSRSTETHIINRHNLARLRPWVVIGLVIVTLQIFLGAWTSTNYAALACAHFPFCQGTLLPTMDWRAAFHFSSPIGPNYEFGHLPMAARVTIQMTHRYGALLTTAYLIPFSLVLMFAKSYTPCRQLGELLFGLIFIQILLGVLNVEWLLPMTTAVAHNGVAAILLLTVISIVFKVFHPSKEIAL